MSKLKKQVSSAKKMRLEILKAERREREQRKDLELKVKQDKDREEKLRQKRAEKPRKDNETRKRSKLRSSKDESAQKPRDLLQSFAQVSAADEHVEEKRVHWEDADCQANARQIYPASHAAKGIKENSIAEKSPQDTQGTNSSNSLAQAAKRDEVPALTKKKRPSMTAYESRSPKRGKTSGIDARSEVEDEIESDKRSKGERDNDVGRESISAMTDAKRSKKLGKHKASKSFDDATRVKLQKTEPKSRATVSGQAVLVNKAARDSRSTLSRCSRVTAKPSQQVSGISSMERPKGRRRSLPSKNTDVLQSLGQDCSFNFG